MSGAALALLGLATVGLAGVLWIRRMRALRLAEGRRGFLVAMAVGALLGAAAWLPERALAPGLLGTLAFLTGGGFLALQLVSRQRPSGPRVLEVGRRMPALRARCADGGWLELASLAGRPFLLKVFRGHW